MRLLTVTGIFCSLTSVGAAQAQAPIILEKLTEWNAAAPPPSQETILSEVKRIAAVFYAGKPGCVASGLALEKPVPATAERQVFHGAVRKQVRNGWTIIARHQACDEAPVRYMIIQMADKSLRTFRVNRGQSYAHESLIGDTMPIAMAAAAGAVKRSKVACDDGDPPKLGILRVLAEEKDLGPDVFGVRYSGSWSAIWPFTVCGEGVEVPVRFTADGDGGAYWNIKNDDVKRISAAVSRR